jgi:hypothetical protein
MNQKPSAAEQQGEGRERRGNLVLRALIDEMLDKVREVSRNSGKWSDEELARAQAELEALMARVRKAAVQPGKSL